LWLEKKKKNKAIALVRLRGGEEMLQNIFLSVFQFGQGYVSGGVRVLNVVCGLWCALGVGIIETSSHGSGC